MRQLVQVGNESTTYSVIDAAGQTRANAYNHDHIAAILWVWRHMLAALTRPTRSDLDQTFRKAA